MARNYAFYFTVALMVISVYLAQSPKMKIVAARDLSETATELKSKLTGQNLMGYRSGCGGYCQQDTDCWDRNYCPRCHYDPIKITYFCGR
ncbi:hypothetical protein RND71_005850 [Anisodus tanguticus]|uniref:Uncharacterized protein n=1 Tax=Anisodus tanguticus TaxID=243964 RepID=A0AAE1VLY2_9SOLA|nr:hypothetical protein RND71_005847 [Anisodus tanguticus]KAK4375173.1 hypothetical protein RND71_005850 [Anisodus tanguticus]